MQSGDFSDIPNPFALHGQSSARAKVGRDRSKLISAAKFLVGVAACFALVLGISHGGKQWLLHRLTADFDSVDAGQQKLRLVQLAEFGSPAIPKITETLAHENIDVARTAYDVLRQRQNDWIVLSSDQQTRCHAALVDAIDQVATTLPDDRTGWATGLLQQTLLTTVDRTDEASQSLYRQTNQTLEKLSLHGRPPNLGLASGSSDTSATVSSDPAGPQRLVVTPRPLPVSGGADRDQWTDWPPPRIVSSPSSRSSDALDAPSRQPQATVYRSSSDPMQTVAPEQAVILRDVAVDAHKPVAPVQAMETSFQVGDLASAAQLVDSPMQAFDDSSVMHWLTSEHAKLREKAQLELISRGYDERELRLASQIAAADVPSRLALVDRIARSTAIDPRPWIWMMARDPHRDVRMRVVSVLATMNDPEAQDRLRQLMVEENDPVVATRIRRVLGL